MILEDPRELSLCAINGLVICPENVRDLSFVLKRDRQQLLGSAKQALDGLSKRELAEIVKKSESRLERIAACQLLGLTLQGEIEWRGTEAVGAVFTYKGQVKRI